MDAQDKTMRPETALDDEWRAKFVVSYLTLRQMIGWIALGMPFIVRVGGQLFFGIPPQHSISAYFYTPMHDLFVCTLVLTGILLTCYRTPARRDNVMAIIVGLAAIGIGLSPMPAWHFTDMTNFVDYRGVFSFLPLPHLERYHYCFVVVFFVLSTYLVYARFRAFTPEMPSRKKKLRNRIYRACGIVMGVCIAGIGLFALLGMSRDIYLPEALASMAFGIAWLVKGRLVLKEQNPHRQGPAPASLSTIRAQN